MLENEWNVETSGCTFVLPQANYCAAFGIQSDAKKVNAKIIS